MPPVESVPSAVTSRAGTSPAVTSPFLAACRKRQDDDRVPVWFMRQAGRSLPEYKQVRVGISMLDSCARPDLVTEITLQPVRRYGVDAAIFYSDIMVPLKAAGVDLDIVPGTGPVIAEPIRTAADLERVRPLSADQIPYVSEAVRPAGGRARGDAADRVRRGAVHAGQLPGRGRAQQGLRADQGADGVAAGRLARPLRAARPDLGDLPDRPGRGRGGAVQLFDSWVGSLSAADYATYVQPHSATVLEAVGRLGVPRIHFGVGTGELLRPMAAAGADVVGVDWRIPLDEADRRLGHRYALQGNLDPALLGAPWPVVAERTRAVITAGASAPGHVFNLGHGVPPDTDPAVLQRIVDLVHEEGGDLRRAAAGA